MIFDIDGTLIDSNDAHARSWVAALAERGLQVPYEEVRSRIGMGGDKLLPEVSGLDPGDPAVAVIKARRKVLFKEQYLPGLRPFPASEELLRWLREQGRRLAVASSAEEDELRPLLRLLGAEELFHATTSSSDAERSKPDPDIVQVALQRLGNPSEEVVMVGDTPYDVAAARAAGIPIIALRCGGWDDKALTGASAIFEGPQHLLQYLQRAVE